MSVNTKKLAAEKALENVRDGMILGLGTGSTAYWAIVGIGERVRKGMKVKAVATLLTIRGAGQRGGNPGSVPFGCGSYRPDDRRGR